MISVQVWDPTETTRYPSIESEIEELTFGRMMTIGYAGCSFKLKRNPRRYHNDIKPTNRVIIRCSRKVAWKGDIVVSSSTVQDSIETPIECDGLGYRLATRATEAPLSSGKLSTWITAALIGDTDLAYTAGGIDTYDYSFPYGIDLSPVSYFAEVCDKGNKANNFRYGVDDTGFYFKPFATTAEYLIRAEDAKYNLDYNIEDIENCLYVTYTPDGSTYFSFWWPNSSPAFVQGSPGTAVPDAVSKGLYRRRDGVLPIDGKSDLAQAKVMAQIALDERRRMRPKTSFVVTRVTDAVTGQVVPLPLVEDGKIIHIQDIYAGRLSSTEAQIINELSTFKNAECSYEVATGLLTVSPGTMGLMMEKIMARIEASQIPEAA